MSMKNPLIPAGIDPGTFRFVAQHLNHCVTAVTLQKYANIKSHENPSSGNRDVP